MSLTKNAVNRQYRRFRIARIYEHKFSSCGGWQKEVFPKTNQIFKKKKTVQSTLELGF